MSQLSRRNFIAGTATTAAVFGLKGPVEFLPSAFAQAALGGPKESLNPTGMQFFRFKIGDMEVTQIFDGFVTRPFDATFIRNAPGEAVQKALAAGGLPDSELPNCFTVTIVKTGGKYVMFDSGNGGANQPRTGRLVENMKAAGIEQKDISTIFVSHYHPDHISGLVNKDNSQVYPNAEIVMPVPEYNFWTGASGPIPEARQALAKRVQELFPNWKNIRRVEGEVDVAPGIRSLPTHGHTPGHTSYHLSSGADQYIVLADLTNIRALFLPNPGWHPVVDQDAPMAEATRRRMFDRIATDRIKAGGYHWGMPGCGTLAKDGNGYVFSPLA